MISVVYSNAVLFVLFDKKAALNTNVDGCISGVPTHETQVSPAIVTSGDQVEKFNTHTERKAIKRKYTEAAVT